MNTQTGRAVALFLNILILGSMWVFSIIYWFDVPDTIPMHFGFSGRPTRFSGSTAINWFMLPVITTLLVAFILWLTGRGMRRYPGLINWSNDAQRRAFMALNGGEREPALKLFYGIGLWLAAFMSGQFFYLHYATYQVGAGRWTGLPAACLLGLIPLAVLLAILIVDLNRKLNKLLRPEINSLQGKGYRMR